MGEATWRNWQDLADAIIIRAVNDYRLALYRNIKRPYQPGTLQQIDEIERFFRSAWFSILSSLDGAQLIRNINKQMGLEAVQ